LIGTGRLRAAMRMHTGQAELPVRCRHGRQGEPAARSPLNKPELWRGKKYALTGAAESSPYAVVTGRVF